jgi:hypothetical protein
MRVRLIMRLAAVLIFILLTSAGTLYALAATGPFPVGSGLFSLQGTAEQAWLNLQSQPFDRAVYPLNLLDRRIHDMVTSIGRTSESIALIEADRALNLVLLELSNLTVEERQATSARLVSEVDRLMQVTGSMRVVPNENRLAVDAF